MISFRDIQRSINEFYFLVTECPEDVKKDIELFSVNSRILYEIITVYLEDLKATEKEIEEEYEFFSKKKETKFYRKVVNYLQVKEIIDEKKRCENLINISTELKEKMEYVMRRVKQFQYFS